MKIEEKMSKDEAERYIDEMAEKLEIDLLDFGIKEKTEEEKKSSLEASVIYKVHCCILPSGPLCFSQKKARISPGKRKEPIARLFLKNYYY